MSITREGTKASAEAVTAPFQQRVKPWMDACFGPEISADKVERNHRFIEEALELVQSTGCTHSEAHQLVDYVFERDVGEPQQEVGGVMVTLAALCLAQGMDMHDAGEVELARIWTKVEKIRAKQAAKPKHSPLPEATPPSNEAPHAEAATAARFARLHGICERIRWSALGSPAMDDPHTADAMGDLAEYLFSAGVDKAMARAAPSEKEG